MERLSTWKAEMAFEFEDSLYAAQPQWLGKEATRRMRVNTEAVQKVIGDI